MSTIVTRTGKGSPLTWSELDANFTNLNADKYQSGDSPSFNAVGATSVSASSVAASTLALASENISGSNGIGFRNRVINGDMRIDQRNAGSSATINTPAYVYTLDRWAAYGQAADGVYTIARSTSSPPTGFSHFLRATVTTADAAVGAAQAYVFRQFIEGNNVADLEWGTANAKACTLTFWVRSSVTGIRAIGIRDESANYSYVYTFFISSANTWEQKTIPITGPTSGTWPTNTNGSIQIMFDLGSGSDYEQATGWGSGDGFRTSACVRTINTLNATFDLTGVQFEVGTVSTPFERRPFGFELSLCQRYYETAPYLIFSTGSIVSGATTLYGWVPYKVTKRGAATLTKVTEANSGFPNTSNIGTVNGVDGFRVDATANATQNLGYINYSGGWTASSEI